MWTTARKIVGFLDRRSRLPLLLLLVPMLATAVLEMLSIGLILPLMNVLTTRDGSGTLIRYLDPFLPDATSLELLTWIAVIFGAVFVIKNIVLFVITYLINMVIGRKLAKFAQHMFDLYLHRPFMFHLQRHSSETMRNLNQSISYAFDGLRLLMMIVLETILITATLLLLLFVEPTMTILAGALLALFGMAFHRISSPVFQEWGARGHAIERVIIKSIGQALTSIRDVKLLNCYDFLKESFAKLTDDLVHYKINGDMARHIPRLVIESLIIVGFVAVILYLSHGAGRIEDTLATLSLFGMASLRLMPSANRLLTSISELKLRTAAVDDLYRDFMDGERDYQASGTGIGGDIPYERDLRLENVTFSYSPSGPQILSGISVSIHKGQSIGFVGPSGAGKTTLLNIVLGLLAPESGRILVDGHDINGNVEGWQKHIGFVPQHLFLIDDTLRRNVAFGLRDEEIDDARIAYVLDLARLNDVVAKLPNGLESKLGEFGSRLSGGQQQRIAIARALYRDPDVLVFDEATAALDNETEFEINQAITALAGKKTILIIAHRLSTVRKCDRIVLMKQGRVAEIGTFDELSATNQDFRRLVDLSALAAQD